MPACNHKSSRRPRIAYVFNHSYLLGGGEISLSELIRSIDKNRFEPVVIVPNDGEIKTSHEEKKIKVLINSLPSLKHITLGKPAQSLVTLSRILKANAVDIIHANGSRACLYGGLAGRFLGIPVIWHVRESLKDSFVYDGLLVLLAQIVVCVSKSVQIKRFARYGNLMKTKGIIVYNGVDTQKFKKSETRRQSFRKLLNIRGNDILFGVVGNIIPRKGQDFLVRGLDRARIRKPNLSVKTLFIGRALDSAFDETLHQMVLNRNLGGEVIFMGYTEQITDIFSALDVFVLPSKSEGFSRSLLEAMSSGLPVLATRTGEIAEAVIEGLNGILIDYNDVEEMASAIIKLSENETLRENMGNENRQRAVGHFDLKSHANSIETLYVNLLSNPDVS